MRNITQYIILLFCFLWQTAYSQYTIPIEHDYIRAIDNYSISKGEGTFTSIKPLNYGLFLDSFAVDSELKFSIKSPLEKKGWLLRKWRYENFLLIDTGNFKIAIDPIFNLQISSDRKSGKNYLVNTRGVRLFGSIDNKLFFESSFYENQATFPSYLNDYILSSRIVPGQASTGYGVMNTDGNFKGALRTFKTGSIDYAYATGVILLRLNKHWDFSLGNGKFFVGEGYRSLLLSDNAFNMPFLKINTIYGKWQYTRIMAILLSDTLPESQNTTLEKRLAGFNMLSFAPNSSFSILLFEGTIWQYPNSKQKINFDYNYYNPVILINSALGNTRCNSIIGINLKLNLFKSAQIYGQAAFDKLNTTKIAFQTGLKYINAFGLEKLYLQGEYNISPSEFYTSGIQTLNYSQLNQPLAHPIGNNFKELILIANYNYKCWQFNAQMNKTYYGNKGIQLPEKKSKYLNDFAYSTPYIGNGAFTNLIYLNFNTSYLINASSNRKIEAGFIRRNALIEGNSRQMNLFYLAFKTSLSNFYYDF